MLAIPAISPYYKQLLFSLCRRSGPALNRVQEQKGVQLHGSQNSPCPSRCQEAPVLSRRRRRFACCPRDGKFIEEVGRYNPQTTPATVTLDMEKVDTVDQERCPAHRHGGAAHREPPARTRKHHGRADGRHRRSRRRPSFARSSSSRTTCEIQASETEDGGILVEVRVHEEDAGKVIGRQGRVIKAIRTLARAAASRTGHAVSKWSSSTRCAPGQTSPSWRDTKNLERRARRALRAGPSVFAVKRAGKWPSCRPSWTRRAARA